MYSELLRGLSVFWALLHIIFLFLMLFRSIYSPKKTLLIAGGGMGVLMALNLILLYLLGADATGRLMIFTCTIPSFLFLYPLSADKKFRFVFTFCIADTVSFWIMTVTNLMDFYLGGGKCILMFVSRLVAFPLVEYAAYRYLRKPYLELQNAVQKGWGAFSCATALYYLLLIFVVQYPNNITNRPEDMPVCILVLALMFFNYEMMFSSLYRQLQLYRRQQSERILQEQKAFLEEQLESQQRIRRLKHDMKGHMVTVAGLLAAEKSEEAMAYLKNVQGDMDSCLGQYCPNPYVNAVLGSYAQKFQELGMELVLDVQIGDEQLPYMELCQILSNGLENAKEALAELSRERRKASVQMKYNRGCLTIRMRNCCGDRLQVEKGAIPKTSKEGSDHGFGLPTILEAAGRLGGDMMCYTEDGFFTVDVIVQAQCLKGA